ncbi:TonB family protein, partial [bacterium]|nr:TonB family protein [bacterium]
GNYQVIKSINFKFILILLPITTIHAVLLTIPIKQELKTEKKIVNKINIRFKQAIQQNSNSLDKIEQNSDIKDKNNPQNISEQVNNNKVEKVEPQKIKKEKKSGPKIDKSKATNKNERTHPQNETSKNSEKSQNKEETIAKKEEIPEKKSVELTQNNQNNSENSNIDSKNVAINNKIDNSDITTTVNKKEIYDNSKDKADYLNAIQSKIQKNRVYPKKAQRLRMEGQVLLFFKVLKNGKIESVKLKKSSGYEILDESAIKLIEKIGSFPPIPETLNMSSWEFSIPITYTLVNM